MWSVSFSFQNNGFVPIPKADRSFVQPPPNPLHRSKAAKGPAPIEKTIYEPSYGILSIMLPHAEAPFRSATTVLPHPSSFPQMIGTFSFGNCTDDPNFPTSHCLPSLWFWLLVAFFFASVGFSVIGALKLIQCCRMRQGRPDVYFGWTGGVLEAGTSSLQWNERERWVDLEQRAWLYSPNPQAAFERTRSGNEVTRSSIEMEQMATEDGGFPLAQPPKWFQKMKVPTAKGSDADLARKSHSNQGDILSPHFFRPEHSRKQPLRSLSVP